MFSKKIKPSEKKYGILIIPHEYRYLFPAPGAGVTVCIDGVEHHKRMHKKYSRIDGLTKIYRKYQTEVTDTITYDVTDGYVTISITKDGKWKEDDYQDWLGDSYSMNGEEIAVALDYSRQNVSQLLKRSLSKCYLTLAKTQKDMTPFEIVTLMSRMLKVCPDQEENANESEVRKFFKLFPANIRRKIKADAAKKLNNVM